jgi:RNA polymerase sigma-70 factor, ECF subfamily
MHTSSPRHCELSRARDPRTSAVPIRTARRDRDHGLVDPPRCRDAGAIDRDADLVDALRSRDATAAEQLIAAYGDRAYSLAVRMTGNREDAEEALQDAFWSVIRAIDTFRGDSAFGSWVYRIVANAACQKLRRRARRRDSISLEEVLPRFDEHGRFVGLIGDWSTTIDDPALQTELRNALTGAFAELPDHYRAAIVLCDVEGLPMAEVADCLGITPAAAKSRAHRARLLLRQRLGAFMSGALVGVEKASQA